MTSHLYILTDGKNTKIGITTDLPKRMASYNTHNATIQLVKKYPCSPEEVKRVETAIKHILKGKVIGKGKEWFAVSHETVDRYVCLLLEKPATDQVMPSSHGVALTDEAFELKEKISKTITSRSTTSEAVELKRKMAEHFGIKFSLGLPEHHLPENIVVKSNLSVDINHSLKRRESALVREAIDSNFVRMPCDDHMWRYFHLVHLSSGHHVALCTARVSMPYLKRFEAEQTNSEVVKTASDLGLYATFHPEWSWHAPDETTLIVYQPKTPVAETLRQWDASFKKWVIERQEILKYEPFPDQEALTLTECDHAS